MHPPTRDWLYNVSLALAGGALVYGGLQLGELVLNDAWPWLSPVHPVAYGLVAVLGLAVGVVLALFHRGFPSLEGLFAALVLLLRLLVRDGFQLGLGNAIELLVKFEVHYACLTLGSAIVFLSRGGGLVYPATLGLRYLRFKVITLISVGGVALGVAALLVVLSVMSGFEDDLRSRIVGTNAQAVLQKRGLDFEEVELIREKVRRVPGVVASSPFVYNEAMVSAGHNLAGVFLRGIDLATVEAVTDLALEQGSLELLQHPERLPTPPGAPEVEAEGILLGRELAKNLKVALGDPVRLMTPLTEEIGPAGSVPRARTYRVAGVFHTGMYEYDAKSVVTTLASAQSFFGLGRAISGLALKVTDLDRVGPVCERVLAAVDGYPFFTRTWYQMNRNLFSALKMQKVAMFIVLVVVILVSAFGIVATLIMLVWEKVKEIAILKSMGATGDGVMKVFLFEGLMIGAAGTSLGVMLGSAVCLLLQRYGLQLDPEVYYIERLPVSPDPLAFLLVAGIAMHIAFLATLYPSARAQRLRPVDGLRYE